ncbi:MAG TPA: hypothetical protein VL463_27705 [Kofleriaceae bacterium]|nr:hypothetical protein [Kofleriaceae bacterium]
MTIKQIITATLFALTTFTATAAFADEDSGCDCASVSDEPGTKTVDDTAPVTEYLRSGDSNHGEYTPSGSSVETDDVIKDVPSN